MKPMSILRIKALMLQQYFLTKRRLEITFDLWVATFLSVVVFGLVLKYLIATTEAAAAPGLFYLGIILWEVVRVSQYTISVNPMWNLWSRNLSNMMVTPLTMGEHICAYMATGAVISFLTLILAGSLAFFLFGVNILALGLLNLALFFINLMLFGFALGLILLGCVLRFGTRIQAITWSLVFLLQPLTAAFFPLAILPNFFQVFACLFPITFVFEAGRESFGNGQFFGAFHAIALSENIIWVLGAWWIFKKMFEKSKDTGQFARNEG
jgi:ABC-2 type transport system permease protein